MFGDYLCYYFVIVGSLFGVVQCDFSVGCCLVGCGDGGQCVIGCSCQQVVQEVMLFEGGCGGVGCWFVIVVYDGFVELLV